MALLARDRAALLVVDVQEGFRPYDCFAAVASACAKLVAAARILQLRTLVSEQYPKGLGHTAPEVGLRDERRIEKSVFSAVRADGFDLGGPRAALADRSTIGQRPGRAGTDPGGVGQVIVCGIEAHVCVSQSVHDLLADGIEVHVPADAVGSRHDLDCQRGLERMERAGAVVSTVEAALFELLERAGTPEFKQVQKLII